MFHSGRRDGQAGNVCVLQGGLTNALQITEIEMIAFIAGAIERSNNICTECNT